MLISPKKLFIELFKYTAIGGLAAIVDIITFVSLTYLLHLDYRIAALISFSLGTFTNFYLSRCYIFPNSKLNIIRACLRHYNSSLGGLLINELVIIYLLEFTSMQNIALAKVIATGAAFVCNFLLIRFYAFNNKLSFIKFLKKSLLCNKF